jgi:dTDP-glucose 4,6-dehydratase
VLSAPNVAPWLENDGAPHWILVTGGAGFIGSNFVQYCLANTHLSVVNLDKLTYAGNVHNLASSSSSERHHFVRGDICDADLVQSLLERFTPSAIIHFAAETHVDRSILGPEDFIQTNVTGTFRLLQAAKVYWEKFGKAGTGSGFRFLHISTDEVYGSLRSDDAPFTESSPYAPNSPYAASKAAADHLVRAYHRTYGLPTLTTNCSNNYGPYQFPEKLIPLTILNAHQGKAIPVYGDGNQVRDWLHVEDHCDAIFQVLRRGRIGETYNVGGNTEINNLKVVQMLCDILDELEGGTSSHARLITFVKDRPGHDRRYAIDCSKIQRELAWRPNRAFRTGLKQTVEWYLANENWIARILTGDYQAWLSRQYAAVQL